MTATGRDFGQRVLSAFDQQRGRDDLVSKGLDLAYIAASAGSFAAVAESRRLHPFAADLELGEKRSCSLASVFLDLTDFTGRTFWDDPKEVADLADAILSAFTELVDQFGGYVLGLRGDGLYAGFGPSSSDPGSCTLALICAARALYLARNSLNPQLETRRIQPVKVRAGLDWGQVTFARSGSYATSEVNVVGFTANFAAKCEKYANSWEIVAGEGIYTQIPTRQRMFTEHLESPKSYQRHYYRRTYRYYQYQWNTLAQEFDEELASGDFSTIRGL